MNTSRTVIVLTILIAGLALVAVIIAGRRRRRIDDLVAARASADLSEVARRVASGASAG